MSVIWLLLKPHLERLALVASRIPWTVWCALLVVCAGWWHLRTDRAHRTEDYQRGRQDAVNDARFDSTMIAAAAKASVRAEQRTDTARAVVRWRIARVDSAAIVAAALARQLPPAIADLPEVVELKRAVFHVEHEVAQLVRDTAQLNATISVERATHRMEVETLKAQLTASRLETVREHDARVVAERRPTRSTAAKITVGTSFLVGVATFLWGSTR